MNKRDHGRTNNQKSERYHVIDELDKQILNLLIANARDSTRTIVRKLADIGHKYVRTRYW